MRFATALTTLLSLAALAAGQASITVQADKPAHKISPMLYGIFFEEINRAGDGGLYAELVQNRSFEDADKPQAWSLLLSGNARASMSLDKSRALNPQNPTALRLEITQAGGRAGVANAGFNGTAVRKGDSYALCFYARSEGGFAGPLTASLERKDGTILAQAPIDGLAGAWKPFTATLTATEGDSAASLVISASAPAVVYLDMVSLFPAKTFKNQPNGMRADLAQMLDDLRPAFVRFPGGCFVEGNRMANATRWKTTIGDVAQRPGHWNLWGYRSTDGLGYHEYLQLCEDLKSEPLFVINCGMAHEDVIPMNKMDEFVQDALDAIEYANGPADSTWGALRAKAGHPAPFNLKYIEIGNENGGPAYQERYALFYDAIKAKYPQMNLVANVPTDRRPTEINDEHYYSNPEFFIRNAHRYDSYDRKGHKVYVGEYAVTQDCGQGNLKAAVGEAAFMTGMERNSDIVVMSSYAPLFVNVGWRQWNPDAICFDSGRAFGTPSYHVQRMFSTNVGDTLLPTQVESAEIEPSVVGGCVGVGTWMTQAEFKDLRVTQGDKVLYESNFAADGMKGWKTLGGDWKVQEGVLRQSAGAENLRAIVGDRNWVDYTYSLKARKLGGAEGFLILFRSPNGGGKNWWNIGGWGNSRHGIEAGGVSDAGVPGKIETGKWYDIRIELKGTSVKCYLDGKLIHDVRMPKFTALYAVASRSTSTNELILKVVNVSPKAVETELNLQGFAPAKSTKVLVLTGGPEDENSLSAPTKVAPIASEIAVPASRLKHTFPACSVTVLRLKQQ